MKRIQRKRTKGFKMPPNSVYVGRPTKWGNPFKVGAPDMVSGEPMTAENCLRYYRKLIEIKLSKDEKFLEPLRDKDLACFCPPDESCHADILLEYLK